MGAAMVAFVLENAKHARRRSDGVTAEAFHRGGDNAESLRVWAERGTWKDARADDGGGARDFAARIARMSLPDFMARWGRPGSTVAEAPAPRAARAEQMKTARVLADVRDLWRRCVPVTDDGEVTAYLRSRGLDAGRVEDEDVARALPLSGSLPSGAGLWRENGHRLVVPFYDVPGDVASVQARCIKANVDKANNKRSFGGAQTKGLMFANRLARGLLTRHDVARDHVLEVSRTEVPRAGVVVCEGIVNFVAWCVDASDGDAYAPAVFGIGAGKGGWTSAWANQIDDGARILVDTDHDADGNYYAGQIAGTFVSRDVELARMERAHG